VDAAAGEAANRVREVRLVADEQHFVEACGQVKRVEVATRQALVLGHVDAEGLAGKARSITPAHARAGQAEVGLHPQRRECCTRVTRLTLALLREFPLGIRLAVLGVAMAQEPNHVPDSRTGAVLVCGSWR